MNQNTFSIRLGQLRQEKGWTTKQLANLIGAPNAPISHWEVGDFYPNNERIVLLADVFNVSIDYLMGRTDCRLPISVISSQGEEIVDLSTFPKEQQELIKSLINQFKK